MINQLLKLANYFEYQLIKISEINDNSVKPMIKQSIESAFKANPYVMDGVLIANYFQAIDSETDPQISFSLWLDKNKKEQLQKTKSERDQLIISILRQLLKQNFGNKNYQFAITDEYK